LRGHSGIQKSAAREDSARPGKGRDYAQTLLGARGEVVDGKDVTREEQRTCTAEKEREGAEIRKSEIEERRKGERKKRGGRERGGKGSTLRGNTCRKESNFNCCKKKNLRLKGRKGKA